MPVFGSQTLGGAEVELGTRRIDKIVVADPINHAFLARQGVFDGDERLFVLCIAFRVNGNAFGLKEIDAGFFVDRRQIEGDVFFAHLTDAYPDVGRDPVPLGVR